MEKMEFSGKQKAEAMQYQWTKRADVWKTEALVLILLTAFAFVINRHMEIKGLYMDDLYQWFCFNDNPFFTAVFTSGGTRFRALYNLVAWTEMKLFGTHVNWYVPFNIVLNSCLAYNLYRMAKRFSHSAYVGILCAVMFLMSRMSYYQIGQALGLMETMAMWMALGILYFLLEYLGDEDETSANRRLYLAAVLYFCVCLVHERYMVLLPLFYFSLLFKLSKNWKLWAAPTVGFALIQLLRFIFIGTISPPGTGGTDVVDTMSVSSVLHFVLSQIAYIFGINAGPEHLNGQNFREAPLGVTILIALADLMIAVLVLAFVIRVLHKGKKMVPYLQKSLYRLLQRDHPCGDALGIRFPGSSSVIPVLDVRQPHRADGKAGPLGSGTSVSESVYALCAVHASGGALLPGPVSKPLLLGRPGALQCAGRGNLRAVRCWNLRKNYLHCRGQI